MNSFSNYRAAQVIARIGHAGQIDKAGRPYIVHLKSVVGLLPANKTYGDVTVAYLHDILEDTVVTITDLKKLGISYSIINSVAILTRDDGEEYFSYINRVKKSGNTTAITVKIADIEEHLLNTSAIPESLVKRYEKALLILQE